MKAKRPDLPKLPLVLIEWNDASFDANAVDEDTVDAVHKPTVVLTLGWVLRDNERGITVVTEKYEGQYRGRTTVLRENIINVYPFKLATRTEKKEAKSE